MFVVFFTYRIGMGALISTGTAAGLLGTSRQHVVNLVDGGRLRNLGTNVHRRLDRDEVLALVGAQGSQEDRKSLWLHTAVAGKVARDPQAAIRRAQGNLARMAQVHGAGVPWLRRWRRLLDAGPEQVLRVLVADTPESRELRQNSPFAGILTERERLQALRGFREATRHEA